MVKLANKKQIKKNVTALFSRRFEMIGIMLGVGLLFYLLGLLAYFLEINFLTKALELGILVPVLVLVFAYSNWDRLCKINPEKYRIWIIPIKFTKKKIFLNMALDSINLTIFFLMINMVGIAFAGAQGEDSTFLMFFILIIPYLAINFILSMIMAAIIYFKKK